jgi:phosphate starvation-inducible membrane PsiE
MQRSRSGAVAGTDWSTESRDAANDERPTTSAASSLPRGRDQTPLRIGVAVAVVVLGCVAADHGDQARIGAWGLIQALPALYFVSTALLTVSFFAELFGRDRSNSLVLAVHVVGMVVLLHGAPGFLESEPRFATAWLHAGFTGQILDRGVSAPKIDARFNWPGFFGAAAAVSGAGGLKSALPLLRWAPVFMVLLYLPSLYVIGRQLTRSSTTAWLGLWLFLLVNWVGQDYFAPQTVGFVLYLTTIAIIVTFFRDGRHLPLGSRLSRWRDELPRDGFPDLVATPRLRIALIVLFVLSAAALAVSHQLSPIALVIGSTFLVLAGRSRLLVYPLVTGILTLGWISVGATPYWVGHLDVIFGGIGDIRAVFSNSVGERIGGSPAHHALVNLRLGYTIVLWALMVASIIFLWVRRRPPVTLAALAAAPFVMVVQSYGTEGVLRIFLFSSPFATLVIAQAAVDLVGRRARRMLIPAVALALVPLFALTRYGNESYEQVRPNEVQALRTLYTIAPPGSELISPTSQVPWRFAHATDYDYSRPRDPRGFRRGDLAAVRVLPESRRAGAANTYLVVTTSQIVYATEALGESPHWFDKVQPLLTPANGYRLVYRNSDALVYEYGGPP